MARKLIELFWKANDRVRPLTALFSQDGSKEITL